MSDDEDYMSDKFLLGSENYSTPSLVRRAADQRELELLKKKTDAREKMRKEKESAKVREEETREKGLASAISSCNKGFKLLEKMGYTPGQGIGKKESGIAEPIRINWKTNRLGLGRTPEIKQQSAKNKSKLETACNTDDFRGRIAQKRNEQMMEIDLRKSQKCCEQLDVQHNVTQPQEHWFWPAVKEETDSQNEMDREEEGDETEDEDESDLIPTCEKLEIIIKYLRNKYFYCIWCAVAYDNDEDLRDNCPGNTRDDH